MPAGTNLLSIGAVLAVVALCGCTTTKPVTPQSGFAESGSVAGADAGFALALPDTVSVLPQSASADAATNADLAALPVSDQPGATAAFAGSTPQAGAAPTGMLAASAEAFPAAQPASYAPAGPAASGTGEIDRLIAKYAALYEVPETLVRHVVNRESTYNPRAYNRGHWGLMQIKHATARGMGYDGPASGLFDAETNLKYAVKYLRGAWLVAAGNAGLADRLYQRGYYYDAKRKGMLEETGLGIDRARRRLKAEPAA